VKPSATRKGQRRLTAYHNQGSCLLEKAAEQMSWKMITQLSCCQGPERSMVSEKMLSVSQQGKKVEDHTEMR
jgi:hypothetical protein